jgi:hypothetical protein
MTQSKTLDTGSDGMEEPLADARLKEDVVERVGRAIYEERNGRGCKPWRNLTVSHRGCYELDARAAIGAMLECAPILYQDGGMVHELRGTPDDIWLMMLKAALQTTEGSGSP